MSASKLGARLGVGDDFILYIFKQDFEMLERCASHSSPNGETGGDLFGLWTNSLNPVVHVVLSSECLYSGYPFLRGQNKTAMEETMRSRFAISRIGVWSVHQPSQEEYISTMADLESDCRFIFLKVNNDSSVSFSPFIFPKIQGYYKVGQVEIISGQNPYRLVKDFGLASDEQNESSTKGGSLVDTFPSGSTEIGSQKTIGIDWTRSGAMKNYCDKTAYSCDDESSSSRETIQSRIVDLPTRYIGEEAASCTKNDQWYVKREWQYTLKEIYDGVKELADKQEVKMARDEKTQNLTLSFVHHDKIFIIEFPPNFPSNLAELKRKGSSRSNRPYIVTKYYFTSRDPKTFIVELRSAVC